MADKKLELTEKMVHTAVEFGVAVVKEMAEGALRTQPNMSLMQFLNVLDQYPKQMPPR